MKIASFVSNIPTMGDTRTYEDFYKYLGVKPQRLGIVSRMYTDLTASFLTESLKNVFYTDAKGNGNKYQSLNAFQYDYDIETNYIKRIEFAAVPEGDGAGGTEIIMAFRERYYEKYLTPSKNFSIGDHVFCIKSALSTTIVSSRFNPFRLR